MVHSEKKKFNVLHVVSRLPVGGVENMLLKVAKGYDKERFNITICCIKEGGEVADELVKAGFNVEILGRMKRHGFDPGAVRALYKLIKKHKIHILRTHQYHANLYGRLAGILAGVPIIIPSFHSRYKSPRKPKAHRKIINYLLAFFSDKLIAVSNTVASDIMKYDKINSEKIKVNYNGVELNSFDDDLSNINEDIGINIPEGYLVIGSVGRLKEEKGYEYLIEAVSEFKNVSLVFAGEGPLLNNLKKKGEKFNVNCIFLGRLSRDKIPFFLGSLDIFCFPSLWEGMPSALIEAMAAGLPIVASDIPPHKEILDDTGIFVPTKDPEALYNAIKMLMDDTPQREKLRRKAQKRSQSFSIERTVTTYQNLFEQLLKEKGLL